MTDQNTDPPRIFLWVNPRSLSTVLEKCINHMDGAVGWHEPYISVYFNRIFANPKLFELFPRMKAFYGQYERAVIMLDSVKDQYEGGNLESSADYTYEYVVEQLEKPLDEGKKFMFIKDMAIGIERHFDMLPKKGNFKHTFLIRNPNRQAMSARVLIKHLFDWEGPVEDLDIGTGQHPFLSWEETSPDPAYRLWKHVREHIDPNPVVIDADDLQNHAEDMLKKYCAAVGIQWKDSYKTWDPSVEWLKYLHGSLEGMVWGKNEGVYKTAFESSKMKPTSGPPPETVPDKAAGYAAEFWEGYKVMYEHRIKPDLK